MIEEGSTREEAEANIDLLLRVIDFGSSRTDTGETCSIAAEQE